MGKRNHQRTYPIKITNKKGKKPKQPNILLDNKKIEDLTAPKEITINYDKTNYRENKKLKLKTTISNDKTKTINFLTDTPIKFQINASSIDQGIVNHYLTGIDEELSDFVVGKNWKKAINSEFTTDTITHNGETYRSKWKEKDYALIKPKQEKTIIIGTHRYGTKAATLHYRHKKPTKTTLIKWKDQNSDQEPQMEEIEVIE